MFFRSLIFSVGSVGFVGFFAYDRRKKYNEREQQTDTLVERIFSPL
jgi:hypothetical protein